MEYYDIDKIKEELKPINVITFLNTRYQRRGKNIFILCPDPKHEEESGKIDRHIGNCIVGDTFQNAYYCFSCGASGNCFKLIACLTGLDLTKDFRKILELACDACGGAQFFSAEKNMTIKKNNTKNRKETNFNLLSRDQLSIIGLAPKNYPCIYMESFGSEYAKECDELFTKDVDQSCLDDLGFPSVSYLDSKVFSYSLLTLLNEDFSLYKTLIKEKSEEAMSKYKSLALKNWMDIGLSSGIKRENDLSYFCECLKDFCKSQYLESEAIWKLFAESEEIENLDDSWLFDYDFAIEKEPGAIL